MIAGTDQVNNTFELRLFPVFPGLTLSLNRIHCYMLPTENTTSISFEEPPFTVNYAISGNCEVERTDGSITAVRGGEFAVSQVNPTIRKQQAFPGNLYEGIELFIDVPVLFQKSPWLMEHFGINEETIRKHYYGKDGVMICTISAVLSAFLRSMANEMLSEDYCITTLRLQVVHLLYDLCTEEYPESHHMYLTDAQTTIARETEARISKDLSATITARELAAHYGISDTSLKNYFRILYGVSMSEYTRQLRMKRAAALLSESKKSVGQISEEVGYTNQSKFASVFRKEFGVTPLEYRRKQHTATSE